MTGTVLNIIAVLIGGSLGTLLGNRLPARVQETVMHGLGLMGLVIGFVMASGTANILIPLFSAVVGGIQDGLVGDYELLAIKSALDGFAAILFAAGLGPGVLLSAGTVAVVQGGLSALGMGIGGGLGDVSRETPWVIEVTAAGGVVILGIGLSLLELKKIRVVNLLPSIAIAPLIVWLLGVSGIGF